MRVSLAASSKVVFTTSSRSLEWAPLAVTAAVFSVSIVLRAVTHPDSRTAHAATAMNLRMMPPGEALPRQPRAASAARGAASLSSLRSLREAGAPDRIRTCDLCLRRAALYPAELRAHRYLHSPGGSVRQHPWGWDAKADSA